MPIYEATAQLLTAVPATSFAALGLKERGDVQRLLAARIDAPEEGLLVLAEEFADWADSARRIDLLCLDAAARLVVVELKRDEDGGHMELQALRYAAMVSAMTFDQAVATLARHRRADDAAARAAILAHLGWSAPQEEAFARETRIILAAADFGKEITTTVLWLRGRYDLDIRCVRLRPHRMDGDRLLLDIQTLIPLPEAEAFQTRIGAKKAAERKEVGEREALLARFLEQLSRGRPPGRTSTQGARRTWRSVSCSAPSGGVQLQLQGGAGPLSRRAAHPAGERPRPAAQAQGGAGDRRAGLRRPAGVAGEGGRPAVPRPAPDQGAGIESPRRTGPSSTTG